MSSFVDDGSDAKGVSTMYNDALLEDQSFSKTERGALAKVLEDPQHIDAMEKELRAVLNNGGLTEDEKRRVGAPIGNLRVISEFGEAREEDIADAYDRGPEDPGSMELPFEIDLPVQDGEEEEGEGGGEGVGDEEFEEEIWSW
jgi:hypothetical protein